MIFAQENGKVDILVEGHDGTTSFNAVLLNSSLGVVESKTVHKSQFNFDNILIDEQYSILVNYKGVEYISTLNVTETLQQLVIQVFEPITSDENIIVSFHHVSITKEDNHLNIVEILEFMNLGANIYNGSDLKIAMPENFENFQSSYSSCVISTDFGFFFDIPLPLMPNETVRVDLRYTLDPDANDYQFTKLMYYDTAMLILTVNSEDLRVTSTSENLESRGLVPIDDQTFDAYSISGIFEGQGFSITVTGYKPTALNLLWIGTGLLLVLIIGAVAYGFRGTRVSLDQLQVDEQSLSSLLKELETNFSEGKITEVEYLKLKLNYTERLENVKSRIQEYSKVNNKG